MVIGHFPSAGGAARGRRAGRRGTFLAGGLWSQQQKKVSAVRAGTELRSRSGRGTAKMKVSGRAAFGRGAKGMATTADLGHGEAADRTG